LSRTVTRTPRSKLGSERAKAAGDSQLNGHEQRSAETRARLISAAIEVFGQVGYEAASTRELAARARSNMSAITYHFGGKKELYLAAAQEMATTAAAMIAPFVDQLDNWSPENSENDLENVVDGFLRVVLDQILPDSWAMFLSRCTSANDEAFSVIYDIALGPLVSRVVSVVGDITPGAQDDEAIRLRVCSTMAALLSFRLLPGIVLRGMGWEALNADYMQPIAAMVRELIRNGFLGGWASAGKAKSSRSRPGT
jgi:AcrR family transcriptional regulator